ncbi:MAG: hypothetical protein ACT4QA_14445 [Panacagrimonas sp.]
MTFVVNHLNQVTMTINVAGVVERYGRVFGTLSWSPPERKSGVWHWCGVSYPETGISVSSQGHGKFEKLTASCWRTHGASAASDGHLSEIEGVFDLTEQTWVGKMVAQN